MLRLDRLVPNGVMAPEGGIDESVVAVVGTPGAFRNRCSTQTVGTERKQGTGCCVRPLIDEPLAAGQNSAGHC